jgi:hypothetical protein
MAKFKVACPYCSATGGLLSSFTVGLSAVERLKEMEQNAKNKCNVCFGSGLIWAQQCPRPSPGDIIIENSEVKKV